MLPSQTILKVRRHYNKWVANQMLEDYALRFTSRAGRRMSIDRVAKTALGATAFLALEGIAAAVTLSYGFTNTLIAMLVVCLVFFITGFPISYYSAKHGLDIDLLTRGAGFGYLGSTITSLIYASFTFIFFAIEAAILASALQALFGIPLSVGYVICAVAVIPVVTHGISAISRFQVGTQTLWLLLQCSALAVVVFFEYQHMGDWVNFAPVGRSQEGHFDILLFGAAASVFFAMVAQIGEQVDYLRFMPPKTEENKRRWWFWLILAGPGWVFVGLIKMLLGSFLAYLAISQGETFARASDPTYMYQMVFAYLTHSPSVSLVLAALMVILSQMKINVTNAYAGSIAWSNFFSRLTHSHPGRVVWLVFNVAIALILMELGIYQALEAILGIFAIVAVSWLASLAADLLINKPLGLSPPYVEFKRAHLYDINPVGTGSMLLATTLGVLCYLGWFGEVVKTLSHFVSLVTCFIAVPLIAWLTGGRYYLARQPADAELAVHQCAEHPGHITCGICENRFEREDMSYCPAYGQPICSLCCSLDARCMDSCKPRARFSAQLIGFLRLFLPRSIVRTINSRFGRFVGMLLPVNLLLGALLALVYRQMQPEDPVQVELLSQTLWTLFFVLLIASGVITWFFLLAHESRWVAQKESNRQTRKLIREIEAHEQTDLALQQAKEQAERANAAKSRYISGISHELRTPLQSILGYAQLLADQPETPVRMKPGLNTIHRSGQYLADLIEGLLDISKIEAGRLELYRNQVQLPELIDQFADMFAMQASGKGIAFHCRILDPLPQLVIADEKRLRQILINLLSNAVKYTASGQVEFEIRYRNQVAEFSIRDTGPGIPKAHLARIFDPFERVRTADSPNLPGTGLGLTIVKLLTEIMGGDLQVESEPGRGSCFSVSLMLPWLDPQTRDKTKAQRVVGYAGYQRTVCLVDDDPVLRGLLSDLLTPLGFRALEAHDAEACLALLQNSQPDLFLLDISMPGMNGLQLARELRNRSIDAPIIMLSADAREYRKDVGVETAYNDYLVKPVENQALLDRVARHLKLEWIYQSAETEPAPPEPRVALSESPSADMDWSIPDHELIHELRAYAEIGYRKGVRATLEKLDQQGVLDAPTLQHLNKLTSTLQFAQLAQCLELSD
ncbi:Two-component hybrid sensor and regulator [Marinobacterium lacunae]|uniref:histidine kinase n=1 Tax=Marinobacterium lacunae TaxID=1232683 RepID=A0A081FTC9_9GAMM|nr:ATP-binding protein [Marinobacterium lacunae]KEA61784.1 Two-component hybrid sensor and regulator [Marinobacterium lacunae]MBR9884551.1 response regulator [Oceanospirillales bacterium]